MTEFLYYLFNEQKRLFKPLKLNYLNSTYFRPNSRWSCEKRTDSKYDKSQFPAIDKTDDEASKKCAEELDEHTDFVPEAVVDRVYITVNFEHKHQTPEI